MASDRAKKWYDKCTKLPSLMTDAYDCGWEDARAELREPGPCTHPKACWTTKPNPRNDAMGPNEVPPPPIEYCTVCVDLQAPGPCGKHAKTFRLTENCNTPECRIKEHGYCAICELDKVKAERDDKTPKNLNCGHPDFGYVYCYVCEQLTQSTERITGLENTLNEISSLNLCECECNDVFCCYVVGEYCAGCQARRALLAPTVTPKGQDD